MRNEYNKKRSISLFFIILTIFCCLNSFVTSEEGVEVMNESNKTDSIDAFKQIMVLDAVEKAEETVNKLKNDSFYDERADELLTEIKTILEISNYGELVEELKKTNRTISANLMIRIGKGLSLKEKPVDDDYDKAIELKGNILSRTEFIYNLKEDIKDLRWKTKDELFWNGLSVKIDLSPLNRSQELFDIYQYDEAGEVFYRLDKEIELKSYQDIEKKKESLKVVLECEKILENIEKDGFDDKVGKDLLKQTKDFFISKNFYSIIDKIEDIDDPSWRDAKELLIDSNLSSERPINEDYAKLEEFKQKIIERKEKLRYIKIFIDELGGRLEKDKSIPELNTKEYSERFDNVSKIFSDHKYDQAFEEAVSIEVELEDKALDLMIEAKNIIKKLNSGNFSTLYLSDLLRSAYDKFAPFQSEELLERYKGLKEDDKIIFVKNELIPVKNSTKKREGYSFVDFSSIIGTIKEIKYREEQIYRISESIKLLSGMIEDYSKRGVDVNVSEKKFGEAVSKFNNENYDDAESSLFEVNAKLELARARLTVLNVLSVEGLSFLQRNKYKIIVVSALVLIFSFYSWIKLRVKFLTKKVNELRAEKDTLENLIKRIQKEHFADGKMPTSIYNIKYEEYTQRLNAVNAAIPVQETMLTKQIKFNRKIEGPLLKPAGKFKEVLKKIGVLRLIRRMKMQKEKREVEKKKKEGGVTLSKGVKDVLFAGFFSLILILIIYLLNILPESFLRYSTLMIFFSFFIVFIALLIRRIIIMPLVFIIVSIATMNVGIFDVKGVELIYVFTAMGILFLLLFYVFNLLMKKHGVSVIISAVLVFSLMPIVILSLISFNIMKTSLYDVLNISLINLLLVLIGSFIALVIWHRFRTIKFMLRMGY